MSPTPMELYINSQGIHSLPNFLKIRTKTPIPENRAIPQKKSSLILLLRRYSLITFKIDRKIIFINNKIK
jgi:hypothetical protein